MIFVDYRNQRNGLIADVGNVANPVDPVKAASLLGNIAGRIVKAEK